jgi:hypothetical protein
MRRKTMIANLGDLRMEWWLRHRNSGDIKWRTKRGDNIAIKDLSDEHLSNIIKMLEDAEQEEETLHDALSGFPNEYLY